MTEIMTDLEYIYRIEIERSTFLTLEDRTYLEWIKAIIDFYQYDSKCEAISSLENILLKCLLKYSDLFKGIEYSI